MQLSVKWSYVTCSGSNEVVDIFEFFNSIIPTYVSHIYFGDAIVQSIRA